MDNAQDNDTGQRWTASGARGAPAILVPWRSRCGRVTCPQQLSSPTPWVDVDTVPAAPLATPCGSSFAQPFL
eukprot:scaffold4196_cov350-Prasinococcus_capsulatus_cf.AAC.1